MCKRAFRKDEVPQQIGNTPYEGETRRLDTGCHTSAASGRWAPHRHFPLWTLWLIWPLALLIKGALVSVAAALAVLGPSLLFHALPIVLVVAGIFLFLHNR